MKNTATTSKAPKTHNLLQAACESCGLPISGPPGIVPVVVYEPATRPLEDSDYDADEYASDRWLAGSAVVQTGYYIERRYGDMRRCENDHQRS